MMGCSRLSRRCSAARPRIASKNWVGRMIFGRATSSMGFTRDVLVGRSAKRSTLWLHCEPGSTRALLSRHPRTLRVSARNSPRLACALTAYYVLALCRDRTNHLHHSTVPAELDPVRIDRAVPIGPLPRRSRRGLMGRRVAQRHDDLLSCHPTLHATLTDGLLHIRREARQAQRGIVRHEDLIQILLNDS